MLKKTHFLCILVLGFFLLALTYGMWVEPYRIEIKHLQIKDSRLNTVLQGKTAVHLTDLHIDEIGKREKKILRIIDTLKPDIIFLTGDYIKWEGNYTLALSFLSELEAKLGVWAVMGDYDYSSSRKSCLFCHEEGSGMPTRKHQVRFLRNNIESISLSNGDALLVGIDQKKAFNYITETSTRLLAGKNPGILLSHNPLIFKSIANDQDVLILAGDTHGGQIPLPAWLWNILGYQKNADYNHGFFQEGMKKMYVSRGIGTSHLPVRINRPPELVVLHF